MAIVVLQSKRSFEEIAFRSPSFATRQRWSTVRRRSPDLAVARPQVSSGSRDAGGDLRSNYVRGQETRAQPSRRASRTGLCRLLDQPMDEPTSQSFETVDQQPRFASAGQAVARSGIADQLRRHLPFL